MASPLVPRLPAGVMLPAPLVVIQFICADGPACRTFASEVTMNHPWLSARYTPWGSAVYIGLAGILVSSRHPPVGDHTSPSLPPRAPDQEPPNVKACPFDNSVMA